jgi:membrane-associated protease RseP (regulator of RpoE activity)
MRVQPRDEELIEEVSNPWSAGLITLAVVVVGLWLNTPLVVMILALVFMIFMHELGHYMTAKWAGMKVTEFFIGFGPRLWSFTRGETEYGLKLIPAGAYVRIIGMSNLEEVDPSEEDRTYRAKSYWRRMSVAVAGSTMHFLMAFVLIFTVFVGFGVQDEGRWHITSISKDSAALDAGLLPGDRVLAVDGQRYDSFQSMSDYIRAHPGETIRLDVERDGDRFTVDAELAATNPDGEEVGFLGIGPAYPYERVAPLTAAVDGVKEFGSVVSASIGGLGHIFSPDGIKGYVNTIANPDDENGNAIVSEDRPTSVVGIARIGSEIAENGFVNVLYLMFGVNIFIGIFNLLPLLPFDGGHVVIATYEKIRELRSGVRRYQADVAKLLPLTYVVVLALALLFVTSLYLDIAHPVSVN